MDFGSENTTRLSWRGSPELLLNEESLVEIITKLRLQVHTLEKNELLSGSALPSWLIKALSEVANNVDAVVECQAMRDQVASLQKEMLELRHEMLVSAANSNSGASAPYNPTPYHRQSTGRSRTHNSAAPVNRPAMVSMPSSKDMTADFAVAEETAALVKGGEDSRFSISPSNQNVEFLLKPLWDFVHKQTNDFSTLRQSFQDAKDTVSRLQAEIKRRDAVVQARNNKHESVVQTQVDKLNENLRSCVTRNDLISAEQQIAQQMKLDRQRMFDEVESRSNKILEDMLASRSDQEDVNSSNAEMMELLARKQSHSEEIMVDFGRKHQDLEERLESTKTSLLETGMKLEVNSIAVNTLEEKARSFEETQRTVDKLSLDVEKALKAHDELKTYMENRMVEKIAESVAIVRSEVVAVQSVVTELVSQNLDGELKALAGKLDMVSLTVVDSVRKITAIQKQTAVADEHNKMQFSQAFDSLDRMQQKISTLSEESMHLSFNLQRAMENTDTLNQEVHEYKEVTNHSISGLQTFTQDLKTDLDKTKKTMENEFSMVKNQLFHMEEVTSAHKREIEETQREVDRNFKSQYHENREINASLESLHVAKEKVMARQDAAESQMLALQAENRAEIQSATAKLVAIVDKESDRVEALYASFQQKQEHFADVVARSSIRNMDLAGINREMDRICENLVSECWKFETSARSSNKASARSSDNNNSNGRKLFNERQQQLLVRDCQFIADLMVARAEYETLQTGCNKEVRNQLSMEELMLDQQTSIMDKVRGKIHTKIMNNKNIGEQFDKSALDRRELYMDTVYNMLSASMKRRTMGGTSNSEPRNNVRSDISSTGSEFLETTRLVSAASGSKGVVRRQTSREAVSGGSSSNFPEEVSMARTAFTPSSTYVLRAGFRLPKASAPNSPATTPLRKDSTSSPLSCRSSLEIGDELAGSRTLLSSPSESSRMKSPEATADNLKGWSTDQSKEDGEDTMNKSFSLPALKQQ
ncbi:hypothetical protein BBJ28_00018198 [Nothophytophthora sp. Chile5]|nr:hypothetical protein BBJ28_00018198 [Nothophytophthora sp. Chile5]